MGRGLFLCFLHFIVVFSSARASVRLDRDHLLVDGKPAPFLYGAELQYFRVRGGPGKNVPAAEVERLWNKLIDRVREAGMNTVIFYIPWDFHEPVENVFDFDGALDQDGDGKPDYPSRNLRRFLDLLVARGIEHIMVRPGPYINAEWGPEGFGAVPRWFLERYPNSLAVTKNKGKPRTAAYRDPVFLEKSQRWIEMLYKNVLKDYIGPGKPVQMLQLDNETNYFWDSVYERDWSDPALGRYRAFLKNRYKDIGTLNAVYGAQWESFDKIFPPAGPKGTAGTDAAWHYDWYAFHDREISSYYFDLRLWWKRLGVDDQVLMTSCDSFNAPDHGLLPRLDWRQLFSSTTMNIYPKTVGTQAQSTLNTPMKAAHDAALVASAHQQFQGVGGNWVMSTETVGGWFPPVEISLATRQHTYGSLLGSGVKAMAIYYFHEGWNWDGFEKVDSGLNFDAPLDKSLEPRPSFGLLKKLGTVLNQGLGDKLNAAEPVRAEVLIAHHSDFQYPVPGQPDALTLASTDSAALFGWLREAGSPPDVGFIDGMSVRQLSAYRLVVWQDPGYLFEPVRKQLEAYLKGGGTILWIGHKAPQLPGRVLHFAHNPADGWNDDRYLKLPHVTEALATAHFVFKRAGIVPQFSLTSTDGLPFVHAWVRRSGKSHLLFVENFARKERTTHLRLHESHVPTGDTFLVRALWRASDGRESFRVTRAALTGVGVTLPVSKDGVDIWEITSAF